MSTLTVGAGMQYATIAKAVAASHDGDVIDINAGTYNNDWLQINDSITLQAVGGNVTMQATVAPPNNKGIIIVGDATHAPNVTIDGITLTGAKISAAEGNNGAGIRYQNGNLTLNNDTIRANQDGLLATPYVAHTGTIIVNNSTFTANGAGDAQSHNIYVNHIAQFTFEDSVSIGAYAGHDIKSRADNTSIFNSTIGDGTSGTASYEIDLPNGGNAIIQGNTIQQGPASQNPVIISYGEEGAILPGSTLTVSGNTVMNDLHTHIPTLVRNSTAVVASIDDNQYYGLTATQLSSGPASLSNDTSLAVEPKLDPTGGGPTSLWISANSTTTNTGYKHATVLVTGNSDGINAGLGGVSLTSTGLSTTVTTLADVTNDITLQNTGYVLSSGNDQITTNTGSVNVVASGHDTIFAGSAGLHLVGYAGGSSSVVGGAGSFAYSGSGGELDYTAGAGSAYIVAGSGPTNVVFGSGATTLNLGSGTGSLTFVNGTGGGNDLINGYDAARDTLTFQGFAGSAIASQISSGGSTKLVLVDGTNITFQGTGVLPPLTGGGPSPPPSGNGSDPTALVISSDNTINNTGSTHTTVLVTGNSDGVNAGSGGVSLTSTGLNTTVRTLAGAANDITLQNTGYVLSSGNDQITTNTGSVNVVASGQDTIFAGSGGLHLTDHVGATSSVKGGAGAFAYSSGGGSLDYTAAAGSAYIVGGAGATNVTFGSGSTTLNLGAGLGNLVFVNGSGGGNDLINGFNAARDTVTFQGFGGSAIASQTSSGSSTKLVLVDGTHITFQGTPSLLLS